MPPPEKRPAPPAPDPNWEMELHPPPGAKKTAPESRDPLLAHALLHASEPDPLDLDLFDEATDVERTTLPPPEAMSDHVARMMAEASAFDEVDDTGDRPTPLVEVPSSLRNPLEAGAPLARDGRHTSAREARPSSPRDARQGTPRARDSRPSSPRDPRMGGAARDARGAPTRDAPQPVARVMVGTATRAAAGNPAQASGGAPRTGSASTAAPAARTGSASTAARAGAPQANPAATPPARPPSWTNMPAVQPARPLTRTEPPVGQAPLRPPSWTNMPAVQPARPPSRSNMPAVQAPARSPSWSNMSAVQPARSPSRTNTPAVKPAAAAAEVPSEPRPRLDSLDFSDLPAVFAFDGLEIDEIAASEPPPRVKSATPPPLPPDAPFFEPIAEDTWAEPATSPEVLEPWSEPAISPASPPWSEPAISPPFDSDDLRSSASKDVSSEKVAAIEARIAAGDYGRALMLAEAALAEHPGDPSVTQHAESCRDKLYKRYLEQLGASDHVPRLALQKGAITGLSLDHRAGFLLSCVDGGSTVEEIIDVSAMPRLDAVRILYELVQEGVIEMRAMR